MFCVVYEFEVTPNYDNEFKKIWNNLTMIFREVQGGLGSRLHKDILRNNIWIAYAQWKSKEDWIKRNSAIDHKGKKLQDRMTEICKNINIIYQLEVMDDLFTNI